MTVKEFLRMIDKGLFDSMGDIAWAWHNDVYDKDSYHIYDDDFSEENSEEGVDDSDL